MVAERATDLAFLMPDGGSIAMRIPSGILQKLGWKEGSPILMFVRGDKLVLEKAER